MSMTAEAIDVYNAYKSKFDKAQETYQASDFAEKLKQELSQPDNKGTIDRIVIVGIGYQPQLQQLSMILSLAGPFEANLQKLNPGQKFLKIYSQEDGRVELHHGETANSIQAYNKLLTDLGITTLEADKSNPLNPARNLITSTTLVFTPWLIANLITPHVHGRNPELYIGTGLDCLPKPDDATMKAIKDLKDAYVWKRLPIYGGCRKCDEGSLSRMCIYQRKETAPDPTWGNSVANLASEPKDSAWPKKCNVHGEANW